MNTLRAGYAQIDITPPVGTDLTGFFSRRQPSTGIHDSLFARAVVLDDSRTRIAIVSCDLLGFSPEFDHRLRTAIARTGVVPADHLMIACTHTHSGPACMPLRGCGRMKAKWMRWLHRKIVSLARNAAKRLCPVTVRYGQHRANMNIVRWGAAFDRPDATAKGHRTRPRLSDVSVIQLRHGFRPFANLVHYPCHAVVMGLANRKVSADFPGVLTSFLTKKTGAPTMFLNGACGNLNPRAAPHCQQPMDFDRLQEVGESLGRIALKAIRSAQRFRNLDLAATFQQVPVPLRIPTIRQLQHTIRGYQLELRKPDLHPFRRLVMLAFIQWAREAIAAVKSGHHPRQTHVSLQRVDLGKLKLIALSGEPFEGLGERIQQRAGSLCLVIGYANGNVGYLPTREAFLHGGYEVDDAHKFYGIFGLSSRLENILLDAVKHLKYRGCTDHSRSHEQENP